MLATSWHKTWGQWLVLGLVALHIVAIVFYLVKKRVNLVQPMLSGDKQLPAGTPSSADGTRQRVLALVLLVLCVGGRGGCRRRRASSAMSERRPRDPAAAGRHAGTAGHRAPALS